jgi:hypothetical protein
VVPQPGGKEADGQGQVPTSLDQFRHPRRIGGARTGRRQAHEQQGGFTRRQGAEGNLHDVLQRHESAPAGYQNQAAGSAWQQRPDLVVAGRVVKEHQHPLAGQTGAPHRGAGVEVVGEVLRRQPAGQQQAAQRVYGGGRALTGAVGVQVEEDLSVGELMRQPVRGMDGERGLAHPRHPIDRADQDRPPGTRRLVDDGLQPVQFLLATCERRNLAGKRSRCRRQCAAFPLGGPPGSRHQRRALGRIEAQSIGQPDDRAVAGASSDAALQHADGDRGNPRARRQRLLREAGSVSIPPQQQTECRRPCFRRSIQAAPPPLVRSGSWPALYQVVTGLYVLRWLQLA